MKKKTKASGAEALSLVGAKKMTIRPGREEAEEAVRTLLRWAGDDPGREGLRDTPTRVVRSYEEFFSGYGYDPVDTDTRSVIEPQPTVFRLFLRNLQPLSSPDTLNPFSIYLTTFGSQQGSDPSITVSAILAGQAGDRFRQSIFVRPATRRLALG